MSLTVSIALFAVGLGLVVYFAERLVKGTVGVSLRFGISAFVISVVFIGFDPENLAVGGVAAHEGAAGIALGSIVGAAMVAVSLAFGITAVLAPMHFAQAPKAILAVPIVAVVLLWSLSVDGRLTRADGAVLLGGFVLSILFLMFLSKGGLDIRPSGEVAETLEEGEGLSRWRSAGLFVVSLVFIIVGSELVVAGSEQVIVRLGLSETVFGMTILALLVSIEELARELPAARHGHPEISYGNIAGSVLAFFLFNAGIIALIRPVKVNAEVLFFYLPWCLLTVSVVSFFMFRRHVSRLAGLIFVALYLVFFVGGYLS